MQVDAWERKRDNKPLPQGSDPVLIAWHNLPDCSACVREEKWQWAWLQNELKRFGIGFVPRKVSKEDSKKYSVGGLPAYHLLYPQSTNITDNSPYGPGVTFKAFRSMAVDKEFLQHTMKQVTNKQPGSTNGP